MKALKAILFAFLIHTSLATAASVAEQLQRSFIWSADTVHSAVFRKIVRLDRVPARADAYVFADSYYALYINGNYVLLGPSRFDPGRPEYDRIDISSYLAAGDNAFAFLVYGGLSNGMRMAHAPGLTFLLQIDDQLYDSNASVRCSGNTRFKQAKSKWEGFIETVDAQQDSGDPLALAFDDSLWPCARSLPGDQWGPLHERSIPLLSEKEVQAELSCALPVRCKSIQASFSRNLLLTVALEVEAAAGVTIRIRDFTYITRAGRQTIRTHDSFGLADADLMIEATDSLVFHSVRFFNRTYPFIRLARFSCDDSVLTRLWDQSIYTMEQVTEDGYQDCVWERAEWMGDAATLEWPLTRIAFSGPDSLHSDPRLIRKIIRDISQSADSSGRLKAHHPSDRHDIHWYIEDYACLWVQALRDYYQISGDQAFLREMWPALTGQMQWFLDHRTASGLVRAREFVIIDNPLCYTVCEGATVNAFVYRALLDAAFLARCVKDKRRSSLYQQAADDLSRSFNALLWNPQQQTYNGSTEHPPSWHSALIPLDRGIVPQERQPLVLQGLLDHYQQASQALFTYTHFWLLKLLFSMDTALWDDRTLELIKLRWQKMTAMENKGYTVGESFSNERPFHNFGAVPAYFLSRNVLGVDVQPPLKRNSILIKPQLGKLNTAQGVVVTEHGPVTVEWRREPGSQSLSFFLDLPRKTQATVALPTVSAPSRLVLDGRTVPFRCDRGRAMFSVNGGIHRGFLETKGEMEK